MAAVEVAVDLLAVADQQVMVVEQVEDHPVQLQFQEQLEQLTPEAVEVVVQVVAVLVVQVAQVDQA